MARKTTTTTTNTEVNDIMGKVILTPGISDNMKTEQLNKITDIIIRLEDSCTSNLFKIAMVLYRVDSVSLYEAGGYKSISEYAEAKFNYKRQTTSALIRIADRFIDASGNCTIRVEGSRQWSVYQLLELLPATDDEVDALISSKTVSPEMSTKAIRREVKAFKALAVKEGEDAPQLLTTPPEAKTESSEGGEANPSVPGSDDFPMNPPITDDPAPSEPEPEAIPAEGDSAEAKVTYFKNILSGYVTDMFKNVQRQIQEGKYEDAEAAASRAIEALSNMLANE